MLNGINILTGDPSLVNDAEKDWWIGELQMRLYGSVSITKYEEEVESLRSYFKIPPQRARILRLLSSGNRVSGEQIVSRCFPKPSEEYFRCSSVQPKGVHVAISNLRKLPEIEIKTLWGFGYRCPPETCEKLKAIMAGEI